MSRIPKIIHQTWKSHDLPEKYIKLVNSWKNKHPDWEYKLYDDHDCIEFIQKYYNELFDTYQSLEEPVMKADMFRYLIVYHFGGLYADLDTEALKSFDELLNGNSKMIIGVELEFDNTILLKMAPVYNNFYKKNNLNKQYIQYCFLSEAKNPLLLEIAKEIARDKHKVFDSIKHANTIIKTGPGIFSKIVQKYINNGYPIKVLDTKYFSGIRSAIKHYLFGINNPAKESYIKHYEMSSWRGQNDLVYTLASCLILGLLINCKIGNYRKIQLTLEEEDADNDRFSLENLEITVSDEYMYYIIQLHNYTINAWEYLKEKGDITGDFSLSNKDAIKQIRTLIVLGLKSDYPFSFNYRGRPYAYSNTKFFKKVDLDDANNTTMLMEYLKEQVALITLRYTQKIIRIKRPPKIKAKPTAQLKSKPKAKVKSKLKSKPNKEQQIANIPRPSKSDRRRGGRRRRGND